MAKTKKSQMVVSAEATPERLKSKSGFQPGHPKWGGRQPGTQNRQYALMSEIMEEAAAQVGSDGEGEGGYIGWLRYMCRTHPVEYLWVLARLQPQKFNMRMEEVKVDVTYETVEQAREALKREGLLIEHDPSDVKR
jgi:hypothetical protein